MATSALVPPMSTVTILVAPASRATWAAPITPEAGPESSVCTGSSAARDAVITPPLDFVDSACARRPRAAAPASRRWK